MPDDKAPKSGHFMGTGLEIAVGVVIGYFTGNWLGNHYGWNPWASVIGAMIGLIAGAYVLIREVNR
jgi:F0F1-type ATP synthase assembly protein I